LELGNTRWPQETRVMGLLRYKPWKKFEDVYRHLDTRQECNGQTDRYQLTASTALTHCITQ